MVVGVKGFVDQHLPEKYLEPTEHDYDNENQL